MESRVFNSRYQIFEDEDAQSQRSKYTSLRDLKLEVRSGHGRLSIETSGNAVWTDWGSSSGAKILEHVSLFEVAETDEKVYVELFWI
ncbi:hypothetical protein SASPL_119416 [Salvia splendens]|uniref:Uncharacterized protein n=1 Tax=Salvia splendens TaxID=180675 RepID=A0A8X8XR14_SALSN|nr:hypothetical protein SASPL_119416 [Salvia splendens]